MYLAQIGERRLDAILPLDFFKMEALLRVCETAAAKVRASVGSALVKREQLGISKQIRNKVRMHEEHEEAMHSAEPNELLIA